MDLSLSFQLLHAVSALVWVAGAAVQALILLASRGDDAAALRAAPEAALVGGRVLRPMGLLAFLSGAALAGPAGAAPWAWAVLGTGLLLASHAARLHLAGPARHTLRLSALDLAAQAGLMVLLLLRPGWPEALILAGALACLLLAVGLLRSWEEPLPA